jgi:hypothetical protein
MKKTFLFAVFFYACFNLQAQNYLPLPDSNSLWIVDVDDGGPGPDFYWVYMTDNIYNDTIINSIPYVKLYYGLMGNYIGGYRSDTSGQTFYIPADSSQEFLLMDLTANTGDTVHNVLYTYGPSLYYPLQYCVVDSVNYINDGPYSLKRLYVRFPNAPGGNEGLMWIEKIGPNGGFFNNNPAGLNYIFLYCMSFNDTLYISQSPNDPIYVSGQCIVPNGINDEINKSVIDVYPNPTNSIFTLQLTNRQFSNSIFTIANALGEKIIEQKIISNKTEINLSNQPQRHLLCRSYRGR